MFHKLPGGSGEYSRRYSVLGHLVQLEYPGAGPTTVYRYTDRGAPRTIAAGDRLTEFDYDADGVLTNVVHQREIEVRSRWRWAEGGALAELRINFDAKSAMADAKFTYEYWKNANILAVKGRIGGQTLPPVGYYRVPAPGGKVAQGAGNFHFSKEAGNGTVLTDGTVVYQRGEGRVSLTLDSRELFTAQYSYSSCNKLEQLQMLLKRPTGYFKQLRKYQYDGAGQLIEVFIYVFFIFYIH